MRCFFVNLYIWYECLITFLGRMINFNKNRKTGYNSSEQWERLKKRKKYLQQPARCDEGLHFPIPPACSSTPMKRKLFLIFYEIIPNFNSSFYEFCKFSQKFACGCLPACSLSSWIGLNQMWSNGLIEGEGDSIFNLFQNISSLPNYSRPLSLRVQLPSPSDFAFQSASNR